MKTVHKVIIGDARKMNELEDESVDLVITSPPYWQLKDYGAEGQIGYNDSYEDYINNLNLVWKELYRVLDAGCRLCINIGDQFARSVYYGRYKVIPIRTEIIKFCETIGFDYMGAIIWQKVCTTNTTGGATIMGSYPYPRNGIIKLDYEFILIFKKTGKSKKIISASIKEQSRLTKTEWNSFFTGHWNFGGEKQESHLAMFPLELPFRLIKMFSFVGDTVLDPFLGSGTTSLAAIQLNRNSIGYEINPAYLNIIKEKLAISEKRLFNKPELKIIRQPAHKIVLNSEFKSLPYIFRDPLKFDKKIDPKKLRFGSKIDHSQNQHLEYFTVKEIMAPNILTLSNGITIRLIGIKPRQSKNGGAIAFLSEMLKGQRVFLKFDETKCDNENNLLCYLYLKNKTFVNAHLIKNKLADVEIDYEYRYKTKFVQLEEEKV